MSDDEMLPKHKRERGGGERRRARESERKAVKRRDRNKGLKEARRYKRATTTMGKARTTERENETRETPTNQPHEQLWLAERPDLSFTHRGSSQTARYCSSSMPNCL